MNWSTIADGAIRACLGAFGQSVTYEAMPEDPLTISAVLGAVAQQEDSAPGRYARIYVRLADFPSAPKRGAKVTIGETTYNVFEVEADGDGGAYLTLHNPDFNG